MINAKRETRNDELIVCPLSSKKPGPSSSPGLSMLPYFRFAFAFVAFFAFRGDSTAYLFRKIR